MVPSTYLFRFRYLWRGHPLVLYFLKIVKVLVAIPVNDYLIENNLRTRSSNSTNNKQFRCSTELYIKKVHFPAGSSGFKFSSYHKRRITGIPGFKKRLIYTYIIRVTIYKFLSTLLPLEVNNNYWGLSDTIQLEIYC